MHFDHAGCILHDKRPYLKEGDLNDRGRWVSPEIKQARTDEMNADMVRIWNGVVSSKDFVYIVGDFAWRRHRRWIQELNGKKILIVGNHDKMPQDDLDLFKPDWTVDDMTWKEALKVRLQFREVHQKLRRKICGQDMTLVHEPARSWPSSVHGAWCLTGHCHGRMAETRPNNASGGLILDVGWPVWGRPISFDEVKKEMMIKLDMMSDNFKNHVLYGDKLESMSGEIKEDEVD